VAAETIEVFVPGQGAGEDTQHDPATGKPWTRVTATATARLAMLHGIDAEMSAADTAD
jgi:hypothetical protein